MWQIPETLAAKKVYLDERVLLDEWDLRRQAEPKDSNPYDPPGGNCFLSTYDRFGMMGDEVGTSETHDMLEQISMKPEFIPRYPRKALINFMCYENTESPSRRAQLLESELGRNPPVDTKVDYCTTTKEDYRTWRPRVKGPLQFPELPFFQNRHCLSELTDSLSVSRHGVNKFLDDNKEQFQTARGLRLGRYKSYDPTKDTYVLGNCPWPPPTQRPAL